MTFRDRFFTGAAAVLLLAGCSHDGDDPLPEPDPPAVNQPPTANAGPDQLVLTGTAVSLSGSGSDPDGSIATLAWTQTSGTAVTLTGANTGTPGFTAPGTAATLVFSLTVTDNQGTARTDSVTVTVNGAPVANAGADQSVPMDANVTLNGSGTDDGTIASYAWTQTAGSAVTLTGGSTAAPTFTAPSAAGTLEFQLTVTDNQGATHSDSVSVSVLSLAAPVIVRQPTHATAFENGIALIFVVAQGENLNYEWHYASGALWTSGPEPYMIRGRQGGLQTSSDGECYYVVVSNDAGSATSEEGCLTVIAIDGQVDFSDDDPFDDQYAAMSFGNAALKIATTAVGRLTGGLLSVNPSAVPQLAGPGENCLGGGHELGATLDGNAITQGTVMPLGQHTYTQVWEDCHDGNVDEPKVRRGGVMITYDFPTVFGEGTYTMYFSGYGNHPLFGVDYETFNGILHVTNARSVGSFNRPQDDIEIALEPGFCAGPLREEPQVADTSIAIERRYDNSLGVVTDTDISVRFLWLNDYEDDGWVGTMHAEDGFASATLHYDPNAGDGEESHSSDDHVVVRANGQAGNEYLGRLRATGNGSGWMFIIDEPDPQFPGDDD